MLGLCALASMANAQSNPNPYLSEKSIYSGPYSAEVVRIVDADTIAVSIPLWPGTTQSAHIRLRGIDAPETRTTCDAEKLLGFEAKEWVEARIPAGSVVRIENIQPDPFSGRFEGDLKRWRSDRWLSVAGELVEKGFAEEWQPGDIAVPWCLLAQERLAARMEVEED